MRRRGLIALTLLTVVAGNALASSRTERQQLVADVLAALDVRALCKAAVVAQGYFVPDVPDADAEVKKGLAHQHAEERLILERAARSIASDSFIVEVLEPAINDAFTDAELRDVAAFARTPEGQKLLGVVLMKTLTERTRARSVSEAIAAARAEREDELNRKYPWRKTISDMMTASTIIGSSRNGQALPTSLDDLARSEGITDASFARDAWNHALQFVTDAEHIRVASAGPDGILEPSSLMIGAKPAGDDIVLEDGEFLQYPKEDEDEPPSR